MKPRLKRNLIKRAKQNLINKYFNRIFILPPYGMWVEKLRDMVQVLQGIRLDYVHYYSINPDEDVILNQLGEVEQVLLKLLGSFATKQGELDDEMVLEEKKV